MKFDNSFLPLTGDYRKLKVFQKSECIYDITYYFCHHFLEKGDRTIDQMIQAARSGRQNIAEGNAAAPTSRETELKLTNVARASLQELLLDYEDYLRQRALVQWNVDDIRYKQCRDLCAKHNESDYYRQQIDGRTAENIANISITLIHQTDRMLRGYIEHLKADFLKQGGIREEMAKARREYRGY